MLFRSYGDNPTKQCLICVNAALSKSEQLPQGSWPPFLGGGALHDAGLGLVSVVIANRSESWLASRDGVTAVNQAVLSVAHPLGVVDPEIFQKNTLFGRRDPLAAVDVDWQRLEMSCGLGGRRWQGHLWRVVEPGGLKDGLNNGNRDLAAGLAAAAVRRALHFNGMNASALLAFIGITNWFAPLS